MTAVRQIHSPFLHHGSSKLVLILLNHTLPNVTPFFWHKAAYRICADGGANRLYDVSPGWRQPGTLEAGNPPFIPDLIKGDMDSLRNDVSAHYSRAGSRIEDDSEDQDSTDLQKCIWGAESFLQQQQAQPHVATVLALGAFGGRLDHTISNINCLYTNPSRDVVLCGDGSMARLLPEGESKIYVSDHEGPHCGIVALGHPARVTSRGLKWDMDDLELQVGGMLSTCNKLSSREVTVLTDRPVLWIIEFKDVMPAL